MVWYNKDTVKEMKEVITMRTIAIITSIIIAMVMSILPIAINIEDCTVVEVVDFDDCKEITVETTEGEQFVFTTDTDAEEWNTKTTCTVVFNTLGTDSILDDEIVHAW